MQIVLDQETLHQAVLSHLQTMGVTSPVREVTFRYTRVPYRVYAEVDLYETPLPKKTKVEPTVAVPETAASIVDPSTVLPVEEPQPDEPPPDMPSGPMFGG